MKNKLQQLITKRLKIRIKSLGLVGSGKMLSETEAKVIFTNDGIDIDVESTTYFKYLDGEYNIIDYVLNESDVDKAITDLYGQMIIDMLMGD